jgi:ATPase family AAA domain-containing protein 2
MNEEESEYEDNLGTPRPQSPPPASLKIRIIKPKLPLESSMIPNHRASRSSTRPPDRPVRETRLRSRVSYDDATPTDDSSPRHVPPPRTTRSGRNAPSMYVDDFPDDEDDDDIPPRRLGKKRMSSTRSTRRSGDTQDFVVDDRNDELSDRPYPLRSRVRKPPTPNHRVAPRRQPSRRKNDDDGDGEFQLTEKSELESDDGPSHDDDAPITSPSPSPGPTHRGNMHVNHSPRGYTLRPQRKPVNYEIPPPLDVDLFADAPNTNGRSKGAGRASRAAFTRTGSQGFLGTFATLPPPPPINNDSDSDDPNNPAAKPLSGPTPSGSGGGLIGGGSLTAGDLAAAAGTPANFGKVSKDSGAYYPSCQQQAMSHE